MGQLGQKQLKRSRGVGIESLMEGVNLQVREKFTEGQGGRGFRKISTWKTFLSQTVSHCTAGRKYRHRAISKVNMRRKEEKESLQEGWFL